MANKRERAAQTVSTMNRTVSRLEDGERGIMEWIMAVSCNDKKNYRCCKEMHIHHSELISDTRIEVKIENVSLFFPLDSFELVSGHFV